MLPLFVVASLPNQTISARELYNEIQNRIRIAPAIKYEFGTGPDSWDSWVTVIIEPGNRYSVSMKNISKQCDGKWFLGLDTGEVTHRPAKSTDIYYVSGLESFYAGVPLLKVSGEVKVDSKYPAWSMSFQKGDKREILGINPETRLPYGVTILPKAQIQPVPEPRNQAKIATDVRERLQNIDTLLLKRTIRYRSYPNKTVTDWILVHRGGTASIEPDAYPGPFQFSKETNTVVSQKQYRSVSAKGIGLRGLESFTGAPQRKYSGMSLLTAPNLYSTSSFTWVLEESDRPTQLDTRTFIELDNNLPVGYEAVNQKGRVMKSIEYNYIAINPKITY